MLSSRLDAIVSLLDKNSIVADIGCDHGKLSVFLLKNKLAEKVFATDISSASLDKAKKLAKDEQVDNIMFFYGDGFSCLPQPVDAAVIAGMGGQVIANIIENDLAKTKLILQPMKDSDILCKKLFSLGFFVEKVVVIRESGRFYEIILAKPGSDTAFDYELPPIDRLLMNEDAHMFLEHKISVLKKALNGAYKANSIQGKKRFDEINRKIELIKEVIKNAYGE